MIPEYQPPRTRSFFSSRVTPEAARALNLEEGREDEFFDRAAAARGQTPADEALVGRLPALFRTLRGRKVTAKNLETLVEIMRKRHSD